MILALCALFVLPQDDCPRTMAAIGKEIRNPERLFPVFQCLLRDGLSGKAHKLLTPKASGVIRSEELYVAFTSFEATRRLVFRMEVHKLRVGEKTGALRICNPEFGVSRDLRIERHRDFWLLDLKADDRDYLTGRALGWFRHQVKRSDGWHFAYPPDWNYAPLRRQCACEK